MSIDRLNAADLVNEPTWTLIIANRQGRPVRQISLLERTKVTVGRAADRDLILDDPRVSRFQCVLYLENRCWCVVDAGSAGGTFVDGERVRWRRLLDQRVVRIGGTTLWVRSGPLPPIDPSRNRLESQVASAAAAGTENASPGDTHFFDDAADDDAPLPLNPAPLTGPLPPGGDDPDDVGMDQTSVFLRENGDFIRPRTPLGW